MLLYYCLVGGGGLVSILSVVCYFSAGRSASAGLKVPAVIGGTLGGLAAGLGLGFIILMGFGYKLEKGGPPGGGPGGQLPPGAKGKLPPGMKQMPGMKGELPPGIMVSMPPKLQLADLIEKLDRLTGQAPGLELSPKEKAGVSEQLKMLAGKKGPENLSDAETRERLGSLEEILKDHKKALQAVGYYVAPQDFQDRMSDLEKAQAKVLAPERLGALAQRLGTGPTPEKVGLPKADSAIFELAEFVEKLDRLTGKPPSLELKAQESAKVRAQLKVLAEKDLKKLTDKEAQKSLADLRAALKDHSEALQAVGSPTEKDAWRALSPERLRALEKRLGKSPDD